MVRHVAAGTGLLHRGLEITVNLRIFILEFDLPAAELHAGKCPAFTVLRFHEAIAPVVPAQREIARRVRAGIKMLMKPLVRRHHDTPRPPIDPLWFFPLRPENRITLTTENDDVGA